MLEAFWSEVAPLVGQTAAAPPRALVLDATRGHVDGSCVLLFPARSDQPGVVLKLARTPLGRAIYTEEVATLRTLAQQGLVSPAVPTVLGSWEISGTLCTAQTALRGVLLKNIPGSQLFSDSRAGRTVDALLEWWRAFQAASGTQSRWLDDDAYEREVLGPVRTFADRFSLNEDEQSFLHRRFTEERRLLGSELPYMSRHGDFCTANVMQGADGIGVFDWEFSLRQELPLFDLFHFFSSLRCPYLGRSGESSHFASFIEVYWGSSPLACLLRSRLRNEADRFAIPADALGDLFVLALLQIANLKYAARLQALSLAPDPSADRVAHVRRLGLDGKDVPFFWMRDGRLENLRQVVRAGVPDFPPTPAGA